MAMNFPSSPTEGQTYTAPGGPTYRYTGGVWMMVGPTYDPHVGQQWDIRLNPTVIDENLTVPTGFNGMSAGPVTLADGASVTLEDGSTWTVV